MIRTALLWIFASVCAKGERSFLRSHDVLSSQDPLGPFGDKNMEIPVPNLFPPIFQIYFLTNITRSAVVDSNKTDELFQMDDPSTWILGRLFYDWSKKMQRIDHGPGSYECIHFYNYDGPCSLIFLPNWGMYRILVPTNTSEELSLGGTIPSTKGGVNDKMHVGVSLSPVLSCCLDIPNLGTPPPDWAREGHPTYNGVVLDSFSNKTAHEWIYDHVVETGSRGPRLSAYTTNAHYQPSREHSFAGPAKKYHTMRQVEESGSPLLFTFPSAGGAQDYHYLGETMNVMDTMDASIFQLPHGCQTQFCKCDAKEA